MQKFRLSDVEVSKIENDLKISEAKDKGDGNENSTGLSKSDSENAENMNKNQLDMLNMQKLELHYLERMHSLDEKGKKERHKKLETGVHSKPKKKIDVEKMLTKLRKN